MRLGIVEAIFLLFICGAVLVMPLVGVILATRSRGLFTVECKACGNRMQRSVRTCPRCGRSRA